MASKSKAKEKDAMRASKTNFWISAGWSETQEKNSCKRTRAFLGSQLAESSREMRALARAARMAKNIRNQSHDGLWHRAEQMNEVGRKTGTQVLKKTESLSKHWNGVNPHLSRATIEQLDLTFNLDGQASKIIKRLPAPDVSAVASEKSSVGL